MNRPTTPARIRYSIRGTPIRLASGTAVPGVEVARDARRPLLIWSEHKPCLRRQTITTQILGIANRSASRSLVVRGALVCRSQGRERRKNGPPIFAHGCRRTAPACVGDHPAASTDATARQSRPGPLWLLRRGGHRVLVVEAVAEASRGRGDPLAHPRIECGAGGSSMHGLAIMHSRADSD